MSSPKRGLKLQPRHGRIRPTRLPHTWLGHRVTRAGYDLGPKAIRRFRKGLRRLAASGDEGPAAADARQLERRELLGVAFHSPDDGFAYGVGDTLLATGDGGRTPALQQAAMTQAPGDAALDVVEVWQLPTNMLT